MWTRSPSTNSGTSTIILYESEGGHSVNGWSGSQFCRCVRLGEGETSEGSSGSSNSSGSSVLGNSEQPISMIGPMYLQEDFPEFFNYWESIYGDQADDVNSGEINYYEAVLFCSQLEYNGYDDWFLPSIAQMEDYIEQQGYVITFLNTTDFTTDLYFWLKPGGVQSYYGDVKPVLVIDGQDNYLTTQVIKGFYNDQVTLTAFNRCFCVR